MSSDPAKHAETVRELLIYADSCGDEDVLRDGNELAAYLDSLPGDGGELADVEWLEAQGWVNRGEYLEFNAESISLDFWPEYKLLKAEGSLLIDTPTRSQVRHLLAALTPATGGK